MKDLIQHVIQLRNNKCYSHVNNHKENIWTGHINQVPINDAFERLNIHSAPSVQSQYTPVWSTMLQLTDLQSAHGLPHFNCKKYSSPLNMSKSNLLYLM